MISFRAGSSLAALLGAAALSLLAPAAAHAGTYGTLAAFQQNIRADDYLEQFNGPDTSTATNLPGGGNGYTFIVTTNNGSTLFRTAAWGVGAAFSAEITRFNFTGTPVSAFGGTFQALAVPSGTPTAITLLIQTNTGESFSVPLPATPTFIGITTSLPFTSLTFHESVGSDTLEFVDNLYVGTSGNAAAAAGQCADAPTVEVGAYAFTTVGAPNDGMANSCIFEGGSPDVFYRFLPTATGLATISTCGCNFDSGLRIFDSCGGTEIACNDDACPTSIGNGYASSVSFRVIAGQGVIVRICGYNGASGSGTLTIAEQADCAADYNHSGTLEVQDIFDFLNGWFAGCP